MVPYAINKIVSSARNHSQMNMCNAYDINKNRYNKCLDNMNLNIKM